MIFSVNQKIIITMLLIAILIGATLLMNKRMKQLLKDSQTKYVIGTYIVFVVISLIDIYFFLIIWNFSFLSIIGIEWDFVTAFVLDKTSTFVTSVVCIVLGVGMINFSSSSMDIRVVAKTATEKQYGVERLLRKEIKTVFDRHNIEIPFTQIVLHHDNKENM